MRDLHHLIMQQAPPSPLNVSGIARILMMLRSSTDYDFSLIWHKKMLLNARRIASKKGDAQLILLAMTEAQ